MVVNVTSNQQVNIGGNHDHPFNKGRLCTLGVAGWKAYSSIPRLKNPLLFDRPDPPTQISWNHALLKMRDVFEHHQKRFGASSVGVIVGGKLTLEEYYLFSKLVGSGLETDSVAAALPELYYESVFGIPLPMQTFETLSEAQTVVLFGEDLARYNPQLADEILSARDTRKSQLIVVNSLDNELSRACDFHVKIKPYTELLLINTLLHAILKEGLIDYHMIEKFCDGFERLKELVRTYSPQVVHKFIGISAEDIYQMARKIGASKGTVLIWSIGLDSHPQRRQATKMMHTLAAVTGNVTRSGGGSFEVPYQTNLIGAYCTGWSKKRSVKNILEAARGGEIKSLWLVGTGFSEWFFDRELLRQALERVEFLVLQDTQFPHFFSRYAHLQLPVMHAAEKEGTIISCERRVNLFQQVFTPPSSLILSDLDIFLRFIGISGKSSLAHSVRGVQGVMEEWQTVSKGTLFDYSGITWEKLQQFPGVLVPCTIENVVGSKTLSLNDMDKRIILHSIEYSIPPEEADIYFPITLMIEQERRADLFQGFRAGSEDSQTAIELNTDDVHEFNLQEGKSVRIYSRRGEISLPFKISKRVMPGSAYIVLNNKTRGILQLFGYGETDGQVLATTVRLETGS